MVHKILLAFSTLALAIASAATSYSVKLFDPATLNGAQLKPGEYRLEVNSTDEIVRGQWISAKHPEGAWRSETTPLEPEWELLKELYQPVNDWS